MEALNSVIQKANEFVNLGKISVAEKILLETLNYVETKADIVTCLLELGNLYFRMEEDYKALQCYTKAYEYEKNKEVLEFILDNYFTLNEASFNENYEKSTKVLKSYLNFYGMIPEYVSIKSRPLWDESNNLIYEREEQFFSIDMNPMLHAENIKKKNLLLINELNQEFILSYEKISNKEVHFLTADEPLYLYYEPEIFEIAMQIVDFEELLNYSRIIVIVGEDTLWSFFDDYQSFVPEYIVNDRENKYNHLIIDCVMKRQDRLMNTYLPEIQQYYHDNTEAILTRVREKKPRVLFYSSRFTTILQYHIRDLCDAAKDMGLSIEVCIEKSDLHRVKEDFYYQLWRFKPDVILYIDHFRFEFSQIPKELLWICWTQDPLPHVMSEETPRQLIENDFILNHYTTWNRYHKLAYPKDKLIEAPVPSNDKIYKYYELSQEERDKYSCDICFVCHASDYRNGIKALQDMIDEEEARQIVEKASKIYYDMAYKEGKFFYSMEEFVSFFKEIFEGEGYDLTDEGLEVISNEFYLWINQKMFRVILVRWLIEAGYTNLKLWGNGWKNEPEFSKYAMGPAQNGETLAKIYQASKIVIGNNIATTAAARAWESMLSGTFYLSNYIPPEDDATDIRKIMKENEDFVMFYDREDLLRKIDFYLNNEAERKAMIERGRQKSLELMTFEALMKKTLERLAEYYQENM